MFGWHLQVNGHELKQTPGDGEGQGSLACCSPWGRKEQNTSERLNNNNKAHGGRQRTSARGCASEAVRVHSGLDFCRDEGLGRRRSYL